MSDALKYYDDMHEWIESEVISSHIPNYIIHNHCVPFFVRKSRRAVALTPHASHGLLPDTSTSERVCAALFHRRHHHHLHDDHLHRHRRHLSLIERRLESAGPDAGWTTGLGKEARSEG